MCFDKTPKHLIICIGTKVNNDTVTISILLSKLNLINLISFSLCWIWKKIMALLWCYILKLLNDLLRTFYFVEECLLQRKFNLFEFLQVYLSLPNSKSLCEGHCLIVPMQHAVSGTVVDEDVWNEIQVSMSTLSMSTLSQMSCETHQCVIIVKGILHWNYLLNIP